MTHLLGTIDAPRAVVEQRLDSPDTGINGFDGIAVHAAVRMHADPVCGAFWTACQKHETPRFQRWKVAL